MFLNKANNSSYNFVAPDIEADDDKVVEVTFPTSESQTVTAAAAVELSIKRQATFVDLGTLGADMALTADIASHVDAGAILTIKAKSDTTARAITPGTGFSAPAVSGTISKTKVVSYIYNGTAFSPLAAAVQID